MVRDPTLALTLTRHHPVHALDVERPLWQVRMHMRMHTADSHAHMPPLFSFTWDGKADSSRSYLREALPRFRG